MGKKLDVLTSPITLMEFIKCDFTALNTHYITLLWLVPISGTPDTYGLKSYGAVCLYQQTDFPLPIHRYTHTHTLTYTHIRTYIHTNTHTYKHIHTHIHIHTHTHIHTHIHTDTHTHIHTHVTYIRILLQQLTVAYLVKIFPSFGSQSFILIPIIACYRFVSFAR